MEAMRLSELLGDELASSLTGTQAELDVAGLTADSRRVEPGFLFAALPGAKLDGAAFIPQAVERGAKVVLRAPGAEHDADSVIVLRDRNPRRRFALLAARFYAPQPNNIAAVTGTNGKTSVAAFTRQIWQTLGRKAASIGTLGLSADGFVDDTGLTTPDPVTLHRLLARLKEAGIEHVAMEASSHGLDQFRLDGVKLAAAAFTNLTRDHLDYHETLEAYAYAKLRLFGELLPPGAVAVINADSETAGEVEALAWARGQRVVTVGHGGRDIRIDGVKPLPTGQEIDVLYNGRRYCVRLPLAGLFQASNALIAAGLAIGLGEEPAEVFSALERLKGATGRLELVATTRAGAPVFVDYAHTPDALKTVLCALRPHVVGRLVVVFGCGGDRDRGKRPLMGQFAVAHADRVIVTDDNPRTENPAAIRAEILSGAAGAVEIADRAEAIASGVSQLGADDLLVVAGKGHETGQIIGDTVKPFNDADVVRRAIADEVLKPLREPPS